MTRTTIRTQRSTLITVPSPKTPPTLCATFESLPPAQAADVRRWIKDMEGRGTPITYALLAAVFHFLPLVPKANPRPDVPSSSWVLFYASFAYIHVGDIFFYFKEG